MRERLTILVIVGTRTDEHSLRSQVGIGSESLPLPSQTPHRLLRHLNPDWFYLSCTGLPRLSWKKGRYIQHIDAIVPPSPAQSRIENIAATCDRPLRRCVNISRLQHLRNALFDALHQLSETHYRKLFSVVTLLQFSGKSRLKNTSFPRLYLLSLLTNTLPGPSTSAVTTLWRYTNLFIIIIFLYAR